MGEKKKKKGARDIKQIKCVLTKIIAITIYDFPCKNITN